jgi:hypothetical protein
LNELLDRPLTLPFNAAFDFLSFITQDLILLSREACLTPELTGRETTASCDKLTITGKLIPLRLNELLCRPTLKRAACILLLTFDLRQHHCPDFSGAA